jgi:glycosyltransferase involved in cell wall biosynthesis
MHIDAEIAFHAAVAAGWAWMTISTVRDVAAVPSLEKAPEKEPQKELEKAPGSPNVAPDGRSILAGSRPGVSVVVPVRDEAARIGATLAGLRAQKDVEIEIIVVDDRSEDATGAIALEAARDDERVRVVRIDALPEGWLGKPHACQRGAELARHAWLLFTDGDIEMSSDVVSRAIRVAETESADHVVLAPDCPQRTFPARIAINSFAALMLHDLARANRDSPRRAVGIGAFNLVRKSAWHAIGEHKALAFEVVDDMRLGLLLARAGFKTRARVALRDIRAEWGGTLRDLVRALDKNMFAHLGYSVTLSLVSATLMAALWLGAITAPFCGTTFGWIAFAAFVASGIVSAILAPREHQPILPALLAPLGLGLIPVVILVSMTLTLSRGGVRWRGRLYPLAELRARRVR